MTGHPIHTDKTTAKELFERFAQNNRWDQPSHDVFSRAYGSLAFALRGEEIRAAAVSVDDDSESFIVLTDAHLYRTAYQSRVRQEVPSSVEVVPLSSLSRIEVATDSTLFTDGFNLGEWPRGVELVAHFEGESLDLTPYLRHVNSHAKAQLSTEFYSTLRDALK